MAINAKATQDFVPIKEVRDGIVILKDGGLRAVILASSINLSLKSYDEQKAVISQFQSFLNSLDFPAQIVIQSRRYDIRPYLETLEKRLGEIQEPLLKIQTREYIEFIKKFTEEVNVMAKRFFIVIPYSQSADTQGSSSKSFLPSFGNKKSAKEQAEASFEEQRSQIEQRIGMIQGGLSGIGIQAVKLGTEEVVELFYQVFNPGESEQATK